MTSNPSRRRRATVAALAAAGIALAGSLAGLGPQSAVASSHREAPLIAGDPAVDNTDLYAFVSPERPGYVTFIANWIPFEEPNGGPNFYPFATDAAYNINVDSDGDAKADAVFRWTFKNIDQPRRQHVPLQQRPGHLARRREPAVPADLHARVVVQRRAVQDPGQRRAGRAVAGRQRRRCPTTQTLRDQATIQLPGGWKHLRRPGRRPVLPRPAGLRPAVRRRPERDRQDTLAGYNVNTIALQVPFKDVALQAATPTATRSIGVWTTTDRSQVRVTGQATQRHPRRPGAGLPPRQPAGQRGRRAGEPEGRLQLDLARTRTPASRPSSSGSPTPSCPS